MNKSRRMMSAQAQSLARRGIGGVIFDLYGTGESVGHFHEAHWNIWLDNVAHSIEWVRTELNPPAISILSLRSGALLARGALEDLIRIESLVFWNPILSGKRYVTGLLRQAVLANTTSGVGLASMNDFREQLSSAKSIEVSGYRFSAKMIQSLERATLNPWGEIENYRVLWLEAVQSPDQSITSTTQKSLDEFAHNRQFSFERITAPAFWQSATICVVPEIIARTTNFLADVHHL